MVYCRNIFRWSNNVGTLNKFILHPRTFGVKWNVLLLWNSVLISNKLLAPPSPSAIQWKKKSWMVGLGLTTRTSWSTPPLQLLSLAGLCLFLPEEKQLIGRILLLDYAFPSLGEDREKGDWNKGTHTAFLPLLNPYQFSFMQGPC